MKHPVSQPLMLLAGVSLVWLTARAAVMLTDWPTRNPSQAEPPGVASQVPTAPHGPETVWTRASPQASRYLIVANHRQGRPTGLLSADRTQVSMRPAASGPVQSPSDQVAVPVFAVTRPDAIARAGRDSVADLPAGPASATGKAAAYDRWQLSAWAYVRPGQAGNARFDIASLGGSQIGARAARRLTADGRVRLVARLTSSGAIGDGIEGGFGLTARPLAALPVDITIERRQQLAGAGGRSAFAAFASGGFNNVPIGADARLDAYAAAGVVGAVRRDLFAEGAVTMSRRIVSIGGVDIDGGAGLWGAAQPGVARLDIGPRISAPLPIGTARPLLAVDWRQRIAGDAAPASGLALTLAADF